MNAIRDIAANASYSKSFWVPQLEEKKVLVLFSSSAPLTAFGVVQFPRRANTSCSVSFSSLRENRN